MAAAINKVGNGSTKPEDYVREVQDSEEAAKSLVQICKRVELTPKSWNPSERAVAKRVLPVANLLLEKYPKSAQCADENGMLPLHHAAKTCTDLSLFESILQAYPEASRIADNCGSLPLHHACLKTRWSEDSSNRKEEMVRALLAAYPEGSRKPDHSGSLPLHLLCKSQSFITATLTKCLLDSYPEACLQKNSSSLAPLDVLTLILKRELDGGCLGQCHLRTRFLRGIAAMLLPFSSRDARKAYHQIQEKLLRGLLKRGDAPEALEILLSDYPSSFARPNQEGGLPLHEFLEARTARIWEYKRAIKPESDLIQSIIEANPEAPKIADSLGRLPLHLIAVRLSGFRLSRNPSLASALRKLVQGYPEAVFIPSPSTGISLFAQALFSSQSRGWDVCLKEILRACSSHLPEGAFPLHDALANPRIADACRCSLEGTISALFFQLSAFNEDGHLPLHMAVHFRMRWDLLDVVREYNPVALITATATPDGYLPLQLALMEPQNAPRLLVEVLLKGGHEATQTAAKRTGCLALHLACCYSERMTQKRARQQRKSGAKTVREQKEILLLVLNANPEAATVRCRAHGRLPLHYACQSNMSLRGGLKALIHAYPGGLEEPDVHGNIPIFYACGSNDVPLERIYFLLKRSMVLFSSC